MEPVACISSPEGTPDGNLPVTKIADGIWDIQIDTVITSGHECGFSPNGKWFTMTNNTRQNSMGVFDVSDSDPRKWKRVTQVKDAGWTGSTPNPFHIAFSIDGSKMFVSELHQKPAKSSVLVIDTNTWKTIKRFDNVGVDCQTMAPSYDGKYVFQIFSGFQRLEGGTFVFTPGHVGAGRLHAEFRGAP
jgi:thiocyanate desulfurase